MTRNMIENKTQKAILEWLKLQYPQVFAHVVKIDNEGKKNWSEAIRCGLHVGASDLFIGWPNLYHHGLWLEIKPDGWKLTKSKQEHHDRQMIFIERMRTIGYAAHLAVGVDECIKIIQNHIRSTA